MLSILVEVTSDTGVTSAPSLRLRDATEHCRALSTSELPSEDAVIKYQLHDTQEDEDNEEEEESEDDDDEEEEEEVRKKNKKLKYCS